jgi:Zn-dependent protease
VLFALGQPAAFAGLVIAFLLAVAVRAICLRLVLRWVGNTFTRVPLLPHPRRDLDPFGAVAAALGGTGWGHGVDDPPRERGRQAIVYAVGPLVGLLLGELGLFVYTLVYPDYASALLINAPSDVLRGAVAPTAGAQMLLSVAVGLLCFGLLALVPLPPLDGWGLLWASMRRPTAGGLRARHWLVDNNLGVVALLVLLIFPFGAPLLHWLFDLVGGPLMRMWV